MTLLPKVILGLVAAGLVAPVPGIAVAQEMEEVPQTETVEKTRAEKRRERREATGGGLLAGAVAGAALGSMVGEAGAGAAVGAVAVGAYSYDQQRQDERTQMLADAIATPKYVAPPAQPAANQATPAQPQAAARETVGDVGLRNMQNFLGDWNLDMWALAVDGSRLAGTGKARGMQAGESAVRVVFTQFEAEAFPDATGGGNVLVSYQDGRGFFLESDFAFEDDVLKLVGEYLVDTNKFNFYLIGASGENPTGIMRSSVRVEMRSSGDALWVAETFAYVDGKETLVQSYRFTRP